MSEKKKSVDEALLDKKLSDLVRDIHETVHGVDDTNDNGRAIIVLIKRSDKVGATICGSPLDIAIALSRVPSNVLKAAIAFGDLIADDGGDALDMDTQELDYCR